jgi:sugar O-acyltransferase (sialic acid O-acetyltransferase NeuD family)
MESGLAILGAGGFGRHVFDVVNAVNRVSHEFDPVVLFDDATEFLLAAGERTFPIEGNIDGGSERGLRWIVAIGDPGVRRRIASRLRPQPVDPIVHPSAWIGGDVLIGPGSIVCAGAAVTTNVRIGRHCQVNMNAVVSHDCRVGDFVTLSPGVLLNGNVTIGDNAFLGTRAVVIPGLSVGDGAFVAAGAVVVRNVPAGSRVAGIPAMTLA